MRLLDGFPLNPIIVIIGWFTAGIILFILIRLNPEFETDELAEYATLGAYVFVVQTIIIPINLLVPFIPISLYIVLSGIPLLVVVKGIKKGLLISCAAIILNHIFVPGALSMLGINLTNMIIAGLIIGYIPSKIYKKMGKRVRSISGFLAGFTYNIIAGFLIMLEFFLTTTSELRGNLFLIVEGFIIWILIIGLLEGIFTAIATSYYHHQEQRLKEIRDYFSDEEDDIDDNSVDKIIFLDEDDEEEDQ